MRPSRPRSRRPLAVPLALAALLALAACDTAEERAQGHYERAMALLAEGDTDRARLEFRNVFRLDGTHTEARLAYARLLRDTGDRQGAVAQYLRLVDQDRANAEGHRDLAVLALEARDYEMAETHAARAVALAPEDPQARAVRATLDFRAGDREGALAAAEAVLAEAPENVLARLVRIAGHMTADDPAAARAEAEAGLALAPEEEALHLARLAALERAGDAAATGAALREMAALFPENEGVTRALVAWHLSAEDDAGAEAVLRAAAARAPGAPEGHLAVVAFLLERQGPQAARAELERLAAEAADPVPYARALAGLDHAEGRTDDAIAALRGLLAGAPPQEGRDVAVALAALLRETGAVAESDALVDGVLAEDRTHVEALKLRARRAIEADAPEAAIRDLRAAAGEAPLDAEIMTLMAMAHEREGSRALMGERLALAAETARFAPPEALRYARFLAAEGRPGPAEGVLVEALRRAPEDPGLLAALGAVHLERGDWPRVARTAALLRGTGDPAAAEAAAGLEMAALEAQGRRDETIALLEGLAETAGEGDLRARVALVRAHLAAGDLEAAEARIDDLLAEDPASLVGRTMRAGLLVLRGETAAAEVLYREILAERPDLAGPAEALVALLAAEGRLEDALVVLETALPATGEDAGLLFARAGLLEAVGDFEGAIALYETLYARDSANPVIANNLASLMAAHRDDAESLERAFQIARRLQGTTVPQFQDTLGWILARRGDAEAALAYLEPAAAALAGDPLVQYHLGMAYLALDRREAARDALARAVDVAGGASALPQIAAARARLAELDAAAPAEGAGVSPPSGG